jgi:hypothetical protein
VAVLALCVFAASGCSVGLEVGAADVGPPDAMTDAPRSGCRGCPSGVCVEDTCCRNACGGICLPDGFQTRSFAVGREPRWVFASDLDGDGFEDLVVPAQLDERIDIAWGRALGDGESPSVGTRIPTGRVVAGLSLHDLDGDARTDVLAIVVGSLAGLLPVRGLGDRAFELRPMLPQSGAPTWVVSLDADRDGTRDLLLRLPEDDCIALRVGATDGSFGADRCVAPYASIDEEERIARFDLDGDGRDELLELRGSASGNRLYVHRFGGDGSVVQSEFLPAPLDVEPERFDVKDLDADGRFELVTFAGFGEGTRAFLRASDGSACELPGGFGVVDTLSDEYVTAVGDFDGDGWLDLAGFTTCGYCEGRVHLHLGAQRP